MASVNLYFYIEDLGLSDTQRETILEQLKAWGDRNQDRNPKERNHWRIRLDGKAAIFELWVDDSNLDAISLRNRLATLFGVAQSAVSYNTTQTAYGPVVTYSYNSVQRFRLGVFGGPEASYSNSQALVRAFLADQAGTWERES